MAFPFPLDEPPLINPGEFWWLRWWIGIMLICLSLPGLCRWLTFWFYFHFRLWMSCQKWESYTFLECRGEV